MSTPRELELLEAMRDLRDGAVLMLQPSLGVTGSMRRYVEEVRRVTEEALRIRATATDRDYQQQAARDAAVPLVGEI